MGPFLPSIKGEGEKNIFSVPFNLDKDGPAPRENIGMRLSLCLNVLVY